MKTTATVTAAIILTAAFVSSAAQAKPQDSINKRQGAHLSDFQAQGFDNKYDRRSDRYKDRYKDRKRSKHANRDVLRLDIPVHVRGSERVHLRRLVNRHYNINLDHYRLKKVVVTNHSRRDASARLRVGGLVSDAQHLGRGTTRLRVPQHSDGRWVLGVNRARIDNIRVVLEPKQRWANHHRAPQRQYPWFAQVPGRR